MLKQLIPVLALLIAGLCPAQTYVVDANNGPGTDYTDLAFAVNQVPDGAVLQVRSGFYFGHLSLQSKGVTILGEPGAVLISDSFAQAVTVRDLTTTQSFSLYGVAVQSTLQSISPYSELLFEDNVGPVMIEQLTSQSNFRVRITSRDCAQLIVRDSSFQGTLQQQGGRVALETTTVYAIDYGGPGAKVTAGELQLVGGQLTGAASFGGSPGAGVELQGGATLRVLGAAALVGGTPVFGTQPQGAAVIGNGSARLDPSVTLLTGPVAFDPNVTVTTVAMPHVTSTSPALGGAIDVTLHGQPGSIGLLVGSPPSVPLTAPIFSDAWWLDPVAGVPLTAGIAPFQAAVATPASPALRGVRLNFQGLTWNGSGFDTSNPSGWVAR